MSPEDRLEVFGTLQHEEKEMRKDGTLAEKAFALYGDGISHEYTMEGLMGLLGHRLKDRIDECFDMRNQLKEEGKNNFDADTVIRNKYEAVFKGKLYFKFKVNKIHP
jgi:hypothetical protein